MWDKIRRFLGWESKKDKCAYQLPIEIAKPPENGATLATYRVDAVCMFTNSQNLLSRRFAEHVFEVDLVAMLQHTSEEDLQVPMLWKNLSSGAKPYTYRMNFRIKSDIFADVIFGNHHLNHEGLLPGFGNPFDGIMVASDDGKFEQVTGAMNPFEGKINVSKSRRADSWRSILSTTSAKSGKSVESSSSRKTRALKPKAAKIRAAKDLKGAPQSEKAAKVSRKRLSGTQQEPAPALPSAPFSFNPLNSATQPPEIPRMTQLEPDLEIGSLTVTSNVPVLYEMKGSLLGATDHTQQNPTSKGKQIDIDGAGVKHSNRESDIAGSRSQSKEVPLLNSMENLLNIQNEEANLGTALSSSPKRVYFSLPKGQKSLAQSVSVENDLGADGKSTEIPSLDKTIASRMESDYSYGRTSRESVAIKRDIKEELSVPALSQEIKEKPEPNQGNFGIASRRTSRSSISLKSMIVEDDSSYALGDHSRSEQEVASISGSLHVQQSEEGFPIVTEMFGSTREPDLKEGLDNSTRSAQIRDQLDRLTGIIELNPAPHQEHAATTTIQEMSSAPLSLDALSELQTGSKYIASNEPHTDAGVSSEHFSRKPSLRRKSNIRAYTRNKELISPKRVRRTADGVEIIAVAEATGYWIWDNDVRAYYHAKSDTQSIVWFEDSESEDDGDIDERHTGVDRPTMSTTSRRGAPAGEKVPTAIKNA